MKRRATMLALDGDLFDFYTAAAAKAEVDRNSVFVAVLRLTSLRANVAMFDAAVEMAQSRNGNTSRAAKMTELQQQRRRNSR